MAESYRLTRVEEIERAKPGFEARVKALLVERRTFSQIAEMLRAEFNVEIAERTLANYWERRFAPEQKRLADAYVDAFSKAQALLELQRQNPDVDREEMVQLLLTGGILMAQEKLADADPLKLLAEERKRSELAIERRHIEVLEAKLKQVEEATNEAAEKIRSGKQLTTEDIERIRERTFGAAPAGAGA